MGSLPVARADIATKYRVFHKNSQKIMAYC